LWLRLTGLTRLTCPTSPLPGHDVCWGCWAAAEVGLVGRVGPVGIRRIIDLRRFTRLHLSVPVSTRPDCHIKAARHGFVCTRLYAMVAGVLITVFFGYALWRFCGAVSVTEHLHWEVAVILSGMVIMLIKIWFWMLMMRNSIIREMKGS